MLLYTEYSKTLEIEPSENGRNPNWAKPSLTGSILSPEIGPKFLNPLGGAILGAFTVYRNTCRVTPHILGADIMQIIRHASISEVNFCLLINKGHRNKIASK